MRNYVNFSEEKSNELKAEIEGFVNEANHLADQIPNVTAELAIESWDFGLNERIALQQVAQPHGRNEEAACHASTLAVAHYILGNIDAEELTKIQFDIIGTIAMYPDAIYDKISGVHFYNLDELTNDRIIMNPERRARLKTVIGVMAGIMLTVKDQMNRKS